MGEVVFEVQPHHRASGLRSARRGKVFCIEGEFVNIHEIAARLGVKRDVAYTRMKKLRTTDGPITWATLRCA